MLRNLQIPAMDGGRGSASSSSIQNSKNAIHMWGGDTTEAQMCQVMMFNIRDWGLANVMMWQYITLKIGLERVKREMWMMLSLKCAFHSIRLKTLLK